MFSPSFFKVSRLAALLTSFWLPQQSFGLQAVNEFTVATKLEPQTNGQNYLVELRFVDNNFDETDYIIQYKAATSSTWLTLGPTGANANSSGLPEDVYRSLRMALTANTNYHFRVGSKKGSTVIASGITTVGTGDLGAPTLKKCQAVGPFSVRLMWEENAVTETGYRVQYKLATATTWSTFGTAGPNGLGPYTITGEVFVPGSNYQFRIQTVRQAAGQTAETATTVDSAVLTTSTPPMAVASNLQVKSTANTSAVLTWSDNTPWETGAAIQVRPRGSSDSAWSLAWRVDYPNETSASITGLTAGVQYEARLVQFVNYQSTGELIGVWTSPVAINLPPVVISPAGLQATPDTEFTHVFALSDATATLASSDVTGRPDWLLYDPATRTLRGKPPTAGNFTVNFSGSTTAGSTVSQVFHVRCRLAKLAPLVAAPMADLTLNSGEARTLEVGEVFTDEEVRDVLKVTLSNYPDASPISRSFHFILYPDSTPATVANFKAYATSGRFLDTVFHRVVGGFVVQGGGFRFTSDDASSTPVWTKVTTDAPVVNEPGLPNVRGTLAMAKLEGDPNSATNQFFMNVDDNSRATSPHPSGLDFQNGGFTVFGRVADADYASMAAMQDLPRATVNARLDGVSVPFEGVPFTGRTGSTLPDPVTLNDFVRITEVTQLAPGPHLKWEVSVNSNPGVASASFNGSQLALQALSPGTTDITVKCTDLDGQFTQEEFQINVPAAMPAGGFAAWSLAEGLVRPPAAAASAEPTADTDGDGQNNLLEYALMGNPMAAATFGQPSLTTTADGHLQLKFACRKPAAAPDIQVSIQAATSMTGNWETVWTLSTEEPADSPVTRVSLDATCDEVTYRDTQPLSQAAAGSRRFLRVKVALR